MRFWFTCFSVFIAIYLFCILECLTYAYEISADESRIIVLNDVTLNLGLPLSYKSQIEQVEGVSSLTYCHVGTGLKDIDEAPIIIISIEAEKYFDLMSEVSLSSEELDQFKREPNACIIGNGLAKEHNWDVGDSVRLKSALSLHDFEFVVRGIYQTKKVSENSFLYCHHLYHTQLEPSLDGKVLTYVIQVEKLEELPQIAQRIDQIFESSFPRTRSQPERLFASNMQATRGNFGVIFRSIGFSVLFATLLVITNTLVMGTREQIHTLASLRVLGYSKKMLQILVFSEALLVSLSGGVFACVVAVYTLHPLGMQNSITLNAMILSLGIGLFAGIFPAWIVSAKNLALRLREIV